MKSQTAKFTQRAKASLDQPGSGKDTVKGSEAKKLNPGSTYGKK